jgi:multidrug resistance efflux pump
MERKNGSNFVNKRSVSHHVVPVMVWTLTVVGVMGLLYNRSRQVAVFGLVQGRVMDVAATCTGRVVGINVKLFDEIKQGQTVAVLDIVPDNKRVEGELRSQLETVSAKIQHLTAQLAPTQEQILAEASRTDTAYAKDLHQFATDEDNARLRILELRALIETDRMKARTLEHDVAMDRKLVDANAIMPTLLERLQMEHETLLTTIRDNETLLDQAQKNLDQAQQRRTAFTAIAVEHPSVDHALEVIRKEIGIQEKLMNEVSTRLAVLRSQQAFELKSPFDGIVSHVALSVGDVADVNMTIVKITQAHPTEVLGYVDQSMVDQIHEGMSVELVRPGPPASIGRAEIVAVGPVVERLPLQLWLRPNVPQWGRTFLVKAPPEMNLLVGERVGIRGFLPKGRTAM